MDGVLVVNEIVELAKTNKKSRQDCLILKLDFEKAHDSISWDFLNYMMDRMGFGTRWLWWIKACIFLGAISILFNGSHSQEVFVSKRLRQGDPLASFLFLIAAEGMTGMFRNAESLGLFFWF